MIIYSFLISICTLSVCQYVVAFDYTQPEQIHISYGTDPSIMIITWNTVNSTKESVVEYGIKSRSQEAIGVETEFKDGGSEKRVQFIHRVWLKNLIPGQKYIYVCGSSLGWSSVFSFTTIKNSTDWSPRFVVIGDLGNVNAQSLPRLQQETERGMYDLLLHLGDFAYDFHSDNARVGDEFMRQIQPIATILPYMTCPGNHEETYNFSNYKHRFGMSMPGDDYGRNMFYSFNIGPVHAISLSTEYYDYFEYGIWRASVQYRWLEEELKEANLPENRAKHPWIITLGHRPMYCSNKDTDDCTKKESVVRTGIPALKIIGLEDLFWKYGVDVELWAHEHTYERLWPVYNGTVYNGSTEFPYTNPGAPVHIITGSAGCQEKTDTFKRDLPPWSAFHSSDYSYTRMTVHNTSHLYIEQVSDDQGGKVIDKMWLIKDKHGHYE